MTGSSERPARTGSLTSRTLDSLAWSSAGAVGQVVLQVVVLVTLSRLLTPDDFGIIAAATLILGFAIVFWQLGVGPAVIQRADLTKEHLETAFTTSILLGLTFAGGILVSASAIAGFFDMPRLAPVLRITTVVFVLGGVMLVAESLLRRGLRFKLLTAIQLTSFAMYGVVSITAAALGAEVWALVAGLIAQSFTKAALTLRMQPHPKRLRIHRAAFRDLIGFGSGVTAAQIANYFALQGDNFVVGRMLGAGPLGVYGRAYSLMAMPANLFATAVDSVLFPAMSRIQTEPERLALVLRRSLSVTALIGLPLSAVAVILAPEVVRVALGDQWDAAVPVLRILAVGIFFRTGYKLGASVARATGHVHQIALRQLIYAVAVVAGSWIGAETAGLEGVAVAVIAALGLAFVQLTALGMRVTGLEAGKLTRQCLPAALLTVTLVGPALAATAGLRHVDAPDLVTLVVVSGLAAAIAVALGRALPRVFLGDDGAWGIALLGTHARSKLLGARKDEPR